MNRLLMLKIFPFAVVCFRGASLWSAIQTIVRLYAAICACRRKIFSLHHFDPELISGPEQ